MNKHYVVTIKATVTRKVAVFAESKDEADELAHESFSLYEGDPNERYDQETLDIEEDHYA